MLMFLFQKKKKHVHLSFKLPLSDYDCFDNVIDLISNNWEKNILCGI